MNSFLIALIPAISWSLAATQGVLVFIFAVFLTFYFPSILEEDHHISTILGKLGALSVIVLGISILYLG